MPSYVVVVTFGFALAARIAACLATFAAAFSACCTSFCAASSGVSLRMRPSARRMSATYGLRCAYFGSLARRCASA